MEVSNKFLITVITLAACTNLGGCSSKDNVIPPSTTTISNIYNGRVQSTSDSQSLRLAVNEPLEHYNTDPNGYTLHNMKRPTFNLLPNPTLYMFVNHKLSEIDRSPIPAFMTEFKMYERQEYALPSEININWESK
jgi:conjugative transfer region lipoprotein (TIGR03751 family)